MLQLLNICLDITYLLMIKFIEHLKIRTEKYFTTDLINLFVEVFEKLTDCSNEKAYYLC
jgi:hypothetical protein